MGPRRCQTWGPRRRCDFRECSRRSKRSGAGTGCRGPLQIGHTNVRSPVGSGAPRLRKAGQYRGKDDALLFWTKRNIALRRRANFMRPVQNRSALLSVSKGVSGADVIIDRQRKSLERCVREWQALQCRGLHRQPAQNLQIDRVHVGAVIRFFRRLQDHGMLVETRIVDQ